ncbi:MAG: hypothetical protein P4L84_05840 [Isosphaeraceae bacterium]|nr:hypothetical protein [Isosphaeraceae bacterium]
MNTSTTTGIADIQFNGSVKSSWSSASSIGNITASVFDASGLFQARTDIGNITMLMPTVSGTGSTRTAADLAGVFTAGGSIGDVNSAGGVAADLTAGGDIGSITGAAGGLNSTLVIAGGNIGDIEMSTQVESTTQISAGGNIGNIHVGSGVVGWRVKAGGGIGDVLVDAGSLNLAAFVAANDLGNVTVTNPEGTAIEGGSLIAGNDIGDVAVYAFNGTAINGTLIQAGNRISSVTGIAYGSVTAPGVTAGVPTTVADTNNGIDKAQILAGEMGAILGQSYIGTGLSQIVVHAQVGNIDSITGIGNGNGIYLPVVVAEGGIGPITGTSTVLGAGIDGGSFDANGKTAAADGTIGQITAQGGPAGGNGISLTRFQASNRIAGIDSTTNANGGDAITTISVYATSIGDIKALVLGGQNGNGIVDSSFRAWSDYENNRPDVQIDGVYADVRSGLGMGISNTIFQIKGDLTNIQATALNASAISGSTFTLTQGDIGRIYAESVNTGNAIDGSIFTASNGSIGSAQTLADAGTSGITVISNGTSALANGIVDSTFSADENIGFISATTRGGTAILNSTFTADSNFGSANNGPNLPTTTPDPNDLGAIFGVSASTSGQNLVSSVGIAGATFTGETIVSVTVSVTDREEGGAGISDSTFTARNAVYDNNGNFNNMGTIGPITVTDGSLRGNGIEGSQFLAGAAGSIGDITVTTLGGIGITQSQFRASEFDYDQSLYNGKIGNISVTTGRSSTGLLPVPAPPNDGWTLLAAGIDTSYFAADAGIGNVTVNSIGTGVFLSAFLADFDALSRFGSIPGFVLPLLAQDVPGNLGNVNITVNGRFGFGSVFSVYTGTNVGNINIAITSRDSQQPTLSLPNLQASPAGSLVQFVAKAANFSLTSIIGPSASAGSLFLATGGNIGSINIVNAGPGLDALASGFVALGSGFLPVPLGFYGPVNPLDFAAGNLFWGIPRLFGNNSGGATVTANSVSLPTNASYKAGSTLYFNVNFSNSVAVTGQPYIPVTIGSTTRDAFYVSGSGSPQLTFALQVQAGDSGQVSIPAGTVIHTDLADRITESATGIELTNLAPPVSTTGSVRVDTVAPTVTSISAIVHSGKKYAVGQLLMVDVTFSEAVVVQGLPMIALTLGNLSRSLVYSGGSGTDTLQFTYTLTKADLAYAKSATIGGGVLLPSGASILDVAGNPAALPAASPAVVYVNTATQAGSHTQAVVHGKAHPQRPLAARRSATVKQKA